ncbi:MAG: FtsX-like permease family protein, partial [Chloroflexota bacterium]
CGYSRARQTSPRCYDTERAACNTGRPAFVRVSPGELAASMTVPQYFRLIGRETRGAGGRLAYFTFCLAIGVAAVVSVASLGSSLGKGFRDGAREMLAADITAETFQPFPPELDTAIAALSKQFDGRVEVTQTREQPTLVSRVDGDGSVLSEIKVIDGTYPFYGSLDLQPPGDFNEFLTADAAVVERKVLDTLRLSVGDVLRVGGQDFTIRAVANAEPDRITGFMYIGPRVFLSKAGFDRTPLGELGVRVRRKTLLKLPDAPAETVVVAAQIFKDALGEDSPLRVENYVEGRRSIQRGLGRLENFLGLIALLSLLLGGVGVAQAVRAWISGRLDSIAVLKCVGVRPREVLALYFGQAAMLGFVGSGAGVLLAILMLIVIPPFLKEYMPADLVDPIQPAAILRGLLLGASVSVVFSLPPLISILRVPPSRVFRRDAEPLAEARWVPWATAIAIVIGVAAMAAL